MLKKVGKVNYVKNSVVVILFLISVVSISCSQEKGKLSRNKAKNLIAEKLKQAVESTNINIGNKSYQINPYNNELWGYKNTVEKEYQEAAAKGLLTITLVEEFRQMLWWDVYKISLTEKAMPYVIKQNQNVAEVKLADYVIEDVTGITVPSDIMGNKVCEATFTFKLKPTPFGECFLPENLKELRQRKAVFVLYDDGWRLEPL